jgi:hypothetical protein
MFRHSKQGFSFESSCQNRFVSLQLLAFDIESDIDQPVMSPKLQKIVLVCHNIHHFVSLLRTVLPPNIKNSFFSTDHELYVWCGTALRLLPSARCFFVVKNNRHFHEHVGHGRFG